MIIFQFSSLQGLMQMWLVTHSKGCWLVAWPQGVRLLGSQGLGRRGPGQHPLAGPPLASTALLSLCAPWTSLSCSESSFLCTMMMTMMTWVEIGRHRFSFSRKGGLCSHPFSIPGELPEDRGPYLITTRKTQKRKRGATSETPTQEAHVLIQVLAGLAFGRPLTSSPVLSNPLSQLGIYLNNV